METPPVLSNLYTGLMVVLMIALVIFGIWLGMKFKPKATESKAVKKHPVTPQPPPEPEPSHGPGHHPYPPHPHPGPDPGPGPSPPPAPSPASKFVPTLTLSSATYNPNAREVHVKYTVDSDTPMPPNRTYSVNFALLVNGTPLSPVTEDNPLEQGDMGFEQDALLITSGMSNNIQGKKFQAQAQIHYHEIGAPQSGVIGTPQTIDIN